MTPAPGRKNTEDDRKVTQHQPTHRPDRHTNTRTDPHVHNPITNLTHVDRYTPTTPRLTDHLSQTHTNTQTTHPRRPNHTQTRRPTTCTPTDPTTRPLDLPHIQTYRPPHLLQNPTPVSTTEVGG